MTSGIRLTILALLTLTLLGGESLGRVLTVVGATRGEEALPPKANLGVSERNLLDLDYSGKYGLPTRALSADETRVLRILAIRVNFALENPDDPLSSGDGNFDMRSKSEFEATEGHLIDPAPHNRDYFNSHLVALDQYWQVVSNGRLKLEWDIYPIQNDSAYQLDSSMAYYGAPPPQYGLTSLFYDAFARADQDTGLKFLEDDGISERYDGYIIFHPGADQQTNLGPPFGPDTPYDLYTGYVKLGLPFAVEEGRAVIYDGMVMPETASQDNRVTALNAVFAHEFGHQLGLVDLYDTRTFVTLCGDFALMDNNGLNVNIDFGEAVPVLVSGVMPVFPCAWSRAYLGFTDVVEISNANNVRLAAAELDTNMTQVIMVPINADEYFLLENRRIDLDEIDPTAVQADSATDVILWPRSPIEDQRENNREYDFLLPGSGMLIWHIDESVARMDYDGDGVDNFHDNKLQWFNFADYDEFYWDNHRRFVRLMEADGIEDFGGEYLSGYGRPEDMFEINNNSSFGPNTNPPSVANNNGFTGITIDDISAAFRVMSCDIETNGKSTGWPNWVGRNAQPLVAFDLNGDGAEEIVTAVGNHILAYRFDGKPLFTADSADLVIVDREVYYGDGVVKDTLAVYASLPQGHRISQSLAVDDMDGDGFAEVVAITDAATIAGFTTATLTYSGTALKLFEVSLTAPVGVAPIIVDYDKQNPGKEIVAIDNEGNQIVMDMDGMMLDGFSSQSDPPCRIMVTPDGSTLYAIPTREGTGVPAETRGVNPRGAALADFNHDDKIETATIDQDGLLTINYWSSSQGNPLSGGSGDQQLFVETDAPPFSEISLADLDNDGTVEILFGGDNKIYAYNHNGTIVSNFPITVNAYIPAGPIRTSPTCVDLDGDGDREIFVGTANGEVAGFDSGGNRLPLYPRAASGRIDHPPVFAISGSNAGVFALSQEGEINGFVSDVPASRDWNFLYGSSANLGTFTQDLEPIRKYSEPISYLYNYPNPAGTETRVRFGLRDNGRVKLKLYNMAGDLVFDTELAGEGSADNEYLLDCSAYASGVYFCLIETEGGDREHCSIAILK